MQRLNHLLARAAVAATLALSLFVAPASAGKLRGKIALSTTSVTKIKQTHGERAYQRALRKQSRGRAVFREDGERQRWTIFYAVMLDEPVASPELTIKLFDVSDGTQFLGTRDRIVWNQQERVVTGKLVLDRDEIFDPNARIAMIVERQGRVLARRDFFIQGEPERYTGEVVFTEDETAADTAAAPTASRDRRR